MKSFFHIVKTACLAFILIGLAFTLASNVASNKSEELKVISSLGSRKVLILNPSPFNITKIAVVNLTFMPSEAYNNTISVYDENGNPVPFQILNATYFSGTHYYRTCSVGMLVTLPSWRYKRYVISFSSKPTTILPVPTDLSILKLNTTTGLVVENSFYRAEFRNDVPYGIYRLYIKNGPSISLVPENWFLFGFSIMFANGSIISPIDFKYVNITIKSLGNLTTTIEVRGHCDVLNYTYLYKFEAKSPWIDVEIRLRPLRKGIITNIYAPLTRIPLEIFDNCILSYNLTIPLRYSEIYPSKSYRPAPIWLMLESSNFGYGSLLTFSFKNFNITEFNEAVLHNINFSLLTKKEAEFVRTLFENISLLFNANDLLAKGKLTVSNIIQMLNAMRNYTSDYLSYLIRWVPYNLSVLDTSMVKRIFIMAMPAYYNLGLHLNETLYDSEIIRFHTSILLLGNSSLTDNPYYDGWLFYIAHKVPLIKVSLPIVASMIIPNRIQVDQRFYVNMTLRLLKDLHYVNITFSYPKEFELLEGNKSISFVDTKAGATFNLSWYLVGLYEGNYTVGALICSEKGNLTLTSIIDVLLPPILPTKTHTLTVKCVDAKGNPVPDHVVLIYNAREGNLVTWNVTNVNGTTIFNDLLEGHYEVKISDGRILNSTLIYLYKDTTVVLKVLKYFIRVNVFLDNGVPLEGVAVYIYDTNGSLVFLGYTNKNGTLVKSGLLPGKYDVEVKIGKLSIDKKSIDVTKQHVVNFVVKVYSISIQALSPEGKPLPGATVTIRNAENNNLVASYVADALGHVSFTLPRGTYVIIVDKDSYHGKRIVEVANNLNMYIICHAPERSWILILIAPTLLVTAFVVRYKRLKSMYSEEVKYRRLLKRLNELYKKGLIEERFYIKLKSEYEEKLRELEGGRP